MKLFVIVFLALSATKEVCTTSRAYKDFSPMFEAQKSIQPQKYKDVILYLKPSELKALKENNVLEVLNDQLYAKNLENSQISILHTQQPQMLQHLQDKKEDTKAPANYKLFNIPLYYPFDLIPVNNHGKVLEDQDKKQTEEIKNHIEEGLRKYFEIKNNWRPVALMQHTQQINTLSPKVPDVVADNLLQLRQTLFNYNIRNVLSFPDYNRLQYELEQLIRNSNNSKVITKVPEVPHKDVVIATDH